MSAITDSLPRGRRHARPRGRPVVIAALAALAAAAIGGAAYTLKDSGASGPTTVSRTVTVEHGVVQSTVSGSGNLEAVHQRELAFTRDGTVTKLYVKAGQRVSEGQVLARLKPTDSALATRYLRAPYTGTLASVEIAVGDTVTGTISSSETQATTSPTTAFQIVQLTSYDLSVSVSESDIGKLKVGQTATVTVSATGAKLAARVSQVGVATDTSDSSSDTTQTQSSSSSGAVAYPVTLRLTQRSSALKPGMTASADIVTAESNGLTVPTQALRGSTVTVVNGTTRQTKRLQLGVAGDSVTEVVSGLQAGDKVLVTSTSAAAGANATPSAGTTQQSQQRSGFGGATGGPPAGGPPGGGLR